MKKNKKIILLLLIPLLLTGCTKTLKDEDNKVVVNEVTGQNLTENILCRPTDEETIRLYEENNVDLDSLPYCTCESDKVTVEVEVEQEDGSTVTETKEVDCESFKITSGGYEGLWTTIFVKPLAYVILFFGRITNSYGVGLIITTLLIRLIAYPVTRKTAMQSEYMKKANPEIARIEKKYANKKDNEAMLQKSQEMMLVYKKYNISPFGSCLLAFIQLPLFFAFLQAINRTPAIFEDTFLGLTLGQTPMKGLFEYHQWAYLIIIALIILTTYLSFRNSMSTTQTGNQDMERQMQFIFKFMIIMISVASLYLSTAIALYWIATNGFVVLQNFIFKKIDEKEEKKDRIIIPDKKKKENKKKKGK